MTETLALAISVIALMCSGMTVYYARQARKHNLRAQAALNRIRQPQAGPMPKLIIKPTGKLTAAQERELRERWKATYAADAFRQPMLDPEISYHDDDREA